MPSPSSESSDSRSPVALRTVAGVLLTAMGVVMAHAVGYLLSHPDPHKRSEALAGHEHLEVFGSLLVVSGLSVSVLLAIFASCHVRAFQELRPSWPKLAAWQLGGFLGLEVIERIGSLGEFVREPAVLIGALLQIPVAWALVRAIEVGSALLGRGAFMVAEFPIPHLTYSGIIVPRRHDLILVETRRSPISRRGPPSRLV